MKTSRSYQVIYFHLTDRLKVDLKIVVLLFIFYDVAPGNASHPSDLTDLHSFHSVIKFNGFAVNSIRLLWFTGNRPIL